VGVTGMTIFIGHGNSPVWRELRDFLEKRLHLSVDEFNSVPVAGVPTVTRLEEMLEAAAFAFLVMTAEDELPDGKLHARLNVVHEAGLFQGKLGFKKAIILLEEGCEEFSNIHGLGQIRFPKSNISAKFEEIRAVLEREGRGSANPNIMEAQPSPISSAEPPLPPNAKFNYRNKVFWAVPRRYTKDEAEDMRRALREVFDCINVKSEPVIASYDGPAPMFTRNWISIIQGQGPQPAIAQLDAIRSQIRAAHTELQEILKRRPYYRQDIMKIIDDRGDSGKMNGALNDYIEALKVLPEKSNVDLIKRAIGTAEHNLEKAIDGYREWISAFNSKMMLIKEELEALME